MLLINLLLSVSLLGFNSGVVPDSINIQKQRVNDDKPSIVTTNEINTIKIDDKVESSSTSNLPTQDSLPLVGSIGNIEESVLKNLQHTKPQAVVVAKPVAKKVVTKPKVAAVVEATAPVNTEATPDFESYIKQMCSKYGCNPDQLIRIMYCESGGRQDRVSSNGKYIGLFQFLPSTFNANADFIPNANIYNGYHQVEVTAKMFADGQAGQWSCK